jgi:1-acyl-sn-glycerol-3-phosphate acyltransferase
MDRREVARLATEVIELVQKRRAEGDHLLVFVEGTRSRTARMQQALAAVSRYLDGPELDVVPLGIRGSERLVPVGEERLHRTRVVVRVGRPIRATELNRLAEGKRRLVMDTVGVAIARLLPGEYRGAYADDADGLERARAVADELERSRVSER